MSHLKRTLVLASLLLGVAAHGAPREVPRSITAEECNERVRKEVIRTANERCKGPATDVIWSEKELAVSADRKTIVAGFAFDCGSKKRYIGLIKTKLGTCEVSRAVTSHTSQVSQSPIKQGEHL